MKTILNLFLLVSIIALTQLYSCVPMRKFEDMKAKRDTCEKDNVRLKDQTRSFSTQVNELGSKNELMEKQLKALQNDTALLGTSMRKLALNHNQITETYNLLLNKNKELLSINAEETKKILADLQRQQESLQKQEDKLKAMEDSIEKKKRGLIILGTELANSREALKQKENEVQSKQEELNKSQAELQTQKARLIELENILSKKDSTVKALKEKVVSALLNFQNNGLTVEQRNGKVYVSLDEKLLFESGSYTVNAKGTEALKNLSKVLESNADVNVLVEGHTDNVPYKGTGQLKDNWDLSVLRATSVVKIMLTNSTINPQRLSAAGRSQYLPIDAAANPEARSKNRRTEIILTPKLDELLKVIETN